MAQVYYQKPKQRSLRCCFCCIEAFSGFLLLMLVATTITLLRYFLEFSSLTFRYSGQTQVSIGPTQQPNGSFARTLAQTMNASVSHQMEHHTSTVPQNSSQSKNNAPPWQPKPPLPLSPPDEGWKPTSPSTTLRQSSPTWLTTTRAWESSQSSLAAPSFLSRSTQVSRSTLSPNKVTMDTKWMSSRQTSSPLLTTTTGWKSPHFSSAASSFLPRSTQVSRSMVSQHKMITNTYSGWTTSPIKMSSIDPTITSLHSIKALRQSSPTWLITTRASISSRSSSASPSSPPLSTQVSRSMVSQHKMTTNTSSGWATSPIKWSSMDPAITSLHPTKALRQSSPTWLTTTRTWISSRSSSASPSSPPWSTQVSRSMVSQHKITTNTSSGWATSPIKLSSMDPAVTSLHSTKALRQNSPTWVTTTRAWALSQSSLATSSFSPWSTQVSRSTVSSKKLTMDTKWMSSSQTSSPVLATTAGWKLSRFSLAASSFLPLSTEVSPQKMASSTERTSSGWAHSPMKLTLFFPNSTVTSLSPTKASRQRSPPSRAATTKRKSSRSFSAFLPWSTHVSHFTVSPEKLVMDTELTSLSRASSPLLPTKTGWKSSCSPSANSSLSKWPPQIAHSTFSPQQQTTDTEQVSSSWATLAIRSSFVSSPTTIKQMPPKSPVAEWSSSSRLPTVFKRIKPPSPGNLAVVSPNVMSPRVETAPLDGNETSQYFQGSFHLLNEVFHSSYSNQTSESFRREALKLENMVSRTLEYCFGNNNNNNNNNCISYLPLLVAH
nr:PREDICTED: chitinase-like protein PB1E7.04c isoform X1 [Anolis carolinensis]|eukprot:XP_016853697.1 PREDICTED: chitinase-like protein PB1E7.04c isoform X1 [Anolis carolinensis]